MLSILCVTKAEPYAWPFLRAMEDLALKLDADLVLCADGSAACDLLVEGSLACQIVPVQSKGFLESVLDRGVASCRDGYVLRLDDDERASARMVEWLEKGGHLTADHWQFPRLHLWPDADHFLDDIQLWPDYQTRLSSKQKSGGRHGMHSPSPFGGGTIAPVAIEHHKFLVKSYDERKAIAAKWHGGGMMAFSVPEDCGRRMESKPVTEALRG